MKTIYLHVGNFKTGTSAIQKFCSDHRAELLEAGYDYLRSARPNRNNTNHGKLPVSLIMKYGGYVPQWYTDKDSYEAVAKSIVEEINRSRCDNIIISSEECYRIASYKSSTLQAAAADLHELFSGHRVKVVMYVREPFAFAKSWYNQVNKGNVPLRRFADFFYYLNKSLLSPQANADFWRSCFGTDCLILEPYNLTGAEHIQCFLELIGVNASVALYASGSLINEKRNEDTLELDRISRIMLLESAQEREKYLKSFVFKNQANTKKLQDKVDVLTAEFEGFCQTESLAFQSASFTLDNLKEYEKEINRQDRTSPSLFRRKLAQFRNSRIVRVARKTL